MGKKSVVLYGNKKSCEKLITYLMFVDDIDLYAIYPLENTFVKSVYLSNFLSESSVYNFIFLNDTTMEVIEIIKKIKNKNMIIFLDKRIIKNSLLFEEIINLYNSGYHIFLHWERYFDSYIRDYFKKNISKYNVIKFMCGKDIGSDQWIFAILPLISGVFKIKSIEIKRKNLIFIYTNDAIFEIELYDTDGAEMNIMLNNIMLPSLNHFKVISSYIDDNITEKFDVEMLYYLKKAYDLEKKRGEMG